MKRRFATVLGAALVLAGVNVALAEQIDNPAYKAWAKYKPGTTVTLKSESDMAGTKTESEVTTTLVEMTPEKAVVEMKMSMVMQGNKMDMPAQKHDVAAKIEKPAEVAGAEKPEVKESTETIEVGGKSYKCKVTETKMKGQAGNSTTKAWTTDEVPGGLVKSETVMDGAMAGTTKMAISSVTIK